MSKIQKSNAEVPSIAQDVDDGLLRKVRGLFTHFEPNRIELHHAMSGGGVVMFWHKEKIREAITSGGPEVMAREIWVNAKDDASTYTGTQRYAMLVWVDSAKNPILHKFNVTGGAWQDLNGEGENDLFEGGEGPNAKGLVAMSMRMATESQKFSVQGAARMLDTQQRALDRYAAQQDELFKGLLTVTQLVKELTDQTFERDMKREDKLMIRDVVKTVGKAAADNLPNVLMRFSPAGSSAVEQLLFKFLAKAGDEKIRNFVGDLAVSNPDAFAAFTELATVLQARQNGDTGGGTPPSNSGA